MAIWVRTNTNQLQVTDADLTGALDLSNPTAPPGFDPAGITGVQFQLSITGAGFVDDSWTAQRSASLSTTGTAPNPDTVLGFVNFANVAGLANTTDSFDLTDSAPNNAVTTADWEQSDVVSSGTAGTSAWATLQKTKGADGATLTIPIGDLTVTITYTPGTPPPSSGSASGAIGWAGSATGAVAHEGASSGAVSWVGSADGATTHEGSASGAVGWAGSATGQAPTGASEGSASGAINWDGSATGTASHEGSASGAIGWAGSADGETSHEGSATGSISWVGSADGSVVHEGASIGAIGWAGSATGEAPTSQQEGSATGSVVWAGTATGTATHEGSAAGTITWDGSATGVTTHSGTAAGSVTWDGSATGVTSAIPSPRKRLEGHRVAVAALEGHRTRQ